MLWGGIDAFTALFIELMRTLEQLGFAEEARAELEALVPREKSIIDVTILQQLGTPQDKADPISVRPLINDRLTERRSPCPGYGHGAGRRAEDRHDGQPMAVLRAHRPARLPGRALAPQAHRPAGRSGRPVAAGSRVAAARQDRLSVPALHRGTRADRDAAVHAAQRRRGEGLGEHGEELDRLDARLDAETACAGPQCAVPGPHQVRPGVPRKGRRNGRVAAGQVGPPPARLSCSSFTARTSGSATGAAGRSPTRCSCAIPA